MAGVKPRNSYKSLFKRLKNLTLPCEYIFLLIDFTVNNEEHIQTNSAKYSMNTRNEYQLHTPTANLTCFQKSAYYAGIKIFNSLSSSLTNFINKSKGYLVCIRCKWKL
jgi:hypothetical protein